MRSIGRTHVLICDDEAGARAVCARALERAGYATTEVPCGLAVLDEVRRTTFDLLVLDVRLPDIDGPEVLRELVELDRDLPCVILSGHAGFDEAILCLRHGAVDFVSKPFDLDAFVRTVDRALAATTLKGDSALLASTQIIFSSLAWEDVVRRILGVLRSLLSADEAGLAIEPSATRAPAGAAGDPVAGATARLASAGGEVLPGPPLPPALAGRLKLREPIVLERGVPVDVPILEAIAPAAGGLIAAPLLVGERPLGAVWAARRPDGRSFGERDLRRAMLLAGLCSLAVENSRLHAASQEQARTIASALDRLVALEGIASTARLSAGLGHELANPGCAVRANLEAARSLIAAGRIDEAVTALRSADEGVNAILDLSDALRPLGSAAASLDGVADLRRVLDGARLLAAHELRPRAALELELPSSLPLVRGNPGRLGQVLLNLLLNAAQAIAPGNPRANRVRVRVEVEAPWVVVRVSDTGRGLEPALADRIFEHGVTSRSPADGHGVGLALSRWIVEGVGGRIQAVPSAQGAVFEVRLAIQERS